MRRTITYASWGTVALVVVYAAAVLVPPWQLTSGHDDGERQRTRVIASVATSPPVRNERDRLPTTPRAARATAIIYATAAFSTIAGKPTDAWIDEVASISTPAWEHHLDAAHSGTAAATSSVTALVLATYPSWAPKSSVGVTVVLRRAGALQSLYLELRVEDGRYLVEATQ